MQERNLRQTATKELLSCSLKRSYALVSFICTLHRGSEVYSKEQKGEQREGRASMQKE